MKKYNQFINEDFDENRRWQKVIADHFYDNGFSTTVLIDTQGLFVVMAKYNPLDHKMFTTDRDKVLKMIEFINSIAKLDDGEIYESKDGGMSPSISIHFVFNMKNQKTLDYFRSSNAINKFDL